MFRQDLVAVAFLLACVAHLQAEPAAVAIFDTQRASATALSADAMNGSDGWAQIAEGEVAHKFEGDAVLSNGRLAIVLRSGGPGAELYSIEKIVEKQSVLRPAVNGNAKVSDVRIVENTPAGGKLRAAFVTADGKRIELSFELKVGLVFVAIDGGGSAGALRIESPCRFAILPDFFADDIVIDAAGLPGGIAELPSENFLLHMLPGGRCIVMAVWTDRERDILAALRGAGSDRQIADTEIPLGKGGKAWVACITGTDVWHTRSIAAADRGKIIQLDWKAPMAAQWRIDWRRADQLADSWDMLVQKADGNFTKYGVYGSPDTLPSNRRRWTTVLGTFSYPAWIDARGRGFVQPLGQNVTFSGPAVIYPLNRTPATPLDAFTVVDIVRGTLGVGPCEYILDLEGQKSQYKGRATCANRDTLNPIYQKNQQRQRRSEIERSLAEVIVFIRHIRGRIESYMDFGRETIAYLEQQKKSHPELEKTLSELQALARQMDQRYAARKQAIKTPDQAAAMIEEFRKNGMDEDGPGAFDKCFKFTAAIVEIGGNQDELVGECRMVIKMVRQRAALAMAADPRMADVAREIRARSQKVLRNPAGHEGARH